MILIVMTLCVHKHTMTVSSSITTVLKYSALKPLQVTLGMICTLLWKKENLRKVMRS